MRAFTSAFALAYLLFCSSFLCTYSQEWKNGRPLIIGHRGFPCKFPEETLEGYKHAIEAGVDYIEMDVVSTEDGVLVTRHDTRVDESTNVASTEEFSKKKTTKEVEGVNKTGFFVLDFKLEEIKKLNAKQRLPFRDHSLDDKGLKVPTLKEVLGLVKEARQKGQNVGAYIETKHSQYHKENNVDLEMLLVEELKESGLLKEKDAIIIQSFERKSLKKLRKLLKEQENVKLPMTWLISCGSGIPTKKDLKAFADEGGTTIGPDKKLLYELIPAPECNQTSNEICGEMSENQKCLGRFKTNIMENAKSQLVEDAHEVGLTVHPFTFRNEDMFMALDFLSNPENELDFFGSKFPNGLGVDGLFIDCPKSGLIWEQSNTFSNNDIKLPNSQKFQRWPYALVVVVLTLALGGLGFRHWKVLRNREKGFEKVEDLEMQPT